MEWGSGSVSLCLLGALAPAAQQRRGPVVLPLRHSKGVPNEGVFKVKLVVGGAGVSLQAAGRKEETVGDSDAGNW